MVEIYKPKPTKRRHFFNLPLLKLNSVPRTLFFVAGLGAGILLSQYIPPSSPDSTPPPPLFSNQGSWITSSIDYAPVRVCFSPEGHCTNGIVEAIGRAQSSIYVQAYSFTSLPIAQALIKAKKRGVDVQVILDKSQRSAKGSKLPLLVQNKIPVSIDSTPGIAHNKVMILDGEYILTGSFNFTNAADSRNAENVLLILGIDLARLFKANWDKRASQATLYTEAP